MSTEDYEDYYYYNDNNFLDISINTLLQNKSNERGINRTNYNPNMSLNSTEDINNISVLNNDSLEYYYHYSYDDAINNIPVGEISMVALVYGLTLVLGVLGNGLVILSIARIRRMQSITNIFLTSLATADLLLLLICVPIKFAKWFSFTWDFGAFLCKAVHYLQNVSVICSVLTLTAMSMERYYAICHPMRAKYKCTKKRTKKIIIGLWLLSFVLATPIIYGQVHKKVGILRKAYWCIDEWGDKRLTKTYALSMLSLILVFPFVIMTVCYTAICLELWNLSATRSKMGVNTPNRTTIQNQNSINWTRNRSKTQFTVQRNVKSNNNTRKQVIKMLVMIIVLFTVCWGPTVIDDVLVAFGKVDKLNYDSLKHMRQAFALMSYFNSCVNPVVYAFMSKHWRHSFQYALCLCSEKEARKYQYSHQMSPITHASVVHKHRPHYVENRDTTDSVVEEYLKHNGDQAYLNSPDMLTNL